MADQPRRTGRLPAGRLWAVLDVLVLAAATYLIGRYAHAFSGFPKGYDAWGHLSKARMIADNWPHVNWNDEWYAGQPAFQGSYPPGYHVLLVAVAKIAHCSLATAMVATAAVATITAVGAAYTLVLALTGSRSSGLLTATLLLGTGTFWDQILELGLYPRTVSFDIALAAAALAALHRRSGRTRSLVATVVVAAAALSTHPVSGILGVALVGLILLVPSPRLDLARRLGRTVAVAAVAVGLAGYFYVPLLLQPRSQSAFTDHEDPVRLATLLWPSGGDLAALQPLLLPGAVLVMFGVAWRLRRRTAAFEDVLALGTDMALLLTPPRPGERVPEVGDTRTRALLSAHWRLWELRRRHRGAVALIAGLLVAVAGVLVYCLLGYAVARFPLYVNGLQPRDLLVYPAVLLAVVIGIGIDVLADRRERLRRTLLRGSSLVAAVGVAALLVPALPAGTRDLDDATTRAVAHLLPPEASDSHDYRIAGTSDETTRFINAVSGTAQTRGYDDHGDLHLDWQYWLEHVFSDPSATPQQREYLARWYAIKWAYSDDTGKTRSMLADDPGFTELGDERIYSNISLWQASSPAPIVTPVTAPSVLVVGDAQHYDVLLRALSMADVDDRTVVPVQGPTSLDDVTARDLAGFDAVMLYGASVGDGQRDARLLRDYVARGGGVLVDGADGTTEERLLGTAGPLPVAGDRSGMAHGSWGFRTGGDPLVAAADVAQWAPAVYGADQPWSIKTAAGLSPWAHPVLSLAAGPVLVAGRMPSAGAGEVIWSGLNLPYHAAAFSSAAESRFLGTMLRSVARHTGVAGAATSRWVNPEHRIVTAAAGTRAVLVRQYLTPDWHATVNGKAARLWQAGPGMTYVTVPDGVTGDVVIDLHYSLGPVERLGVAVSVLSALVVLLWCIPGRVRRLRQRLSADALGRIEHLSGHDALEVPPVRVPVTSRRS